MMSGMAAFMAAVGGTSLICYLLMNRNLPFWFGSDSSSSDSSTSSIPAAEAEAATAAAAAVVAPIDAEKHR